MDCSSVREENKRIAVEIQQLVERNTQLQRDMMRLSQEKEFVVAEGEKRVNALSSEVEDAEGSLSSVKLECTTILQYLRHLDTLDPEYVYSPFASDPDSTRFSEDNEPQLSSIPPAALVRIQSFNHQQGIKSQPEADMSEPSVVPYEGPQRKTREIVIL